MGRAFDPFRRKPRLNIAERVGRLLERRGIIERDMEHAWLASTGEAGALDDLIGHCITYRIAVGPRAGQKLFTSV